MFLHTANDALFSFLIFALVLCFLYKVANFCYLVGNLFSVSMLIWTKYWWWIKPKILIAKSFFFYLFLISPNIHKWLSIRTKTKNQTIIKNCTKLNSKFKFPFAKILSNRTISHTNWIRKIYQKYDISDRGPSIGKIMNTFFFSFSISLSLSLLSISHKHHKNKLTQTFLNLSPYFFLS